VIHDDLLSGGFGRGAPEIVFVPAHPADREGSDLVFEVRELADGTPVLPVYSSTARLVDALGPAQPWAAFPLQTTRDMMARAGVGMVVLDPQIAPGAPRWRPEDLAEMAESITDPAGKEPW
jgi:hypothetical protein